ncbi:MAG: hypothetical protein ACAF41_33255 (plasmid) [Leptolyngbya sp. BL-A-14]
MHKFRIVKVAATVLVSGLLLMDSVCLPQPATAQQCRKTYPGKNLSLRSLNRTGAVLIHNDTGKPMSFTLYHPDSGLPNGTWTINPNGNTWLPTSNYYVGDDWGIQMGNGCIYYINETATYSRFSNGQTAYEVYLYMEYPSSGNDPSFGLDGYLVLSKKPPRKVR